MRLVPPQIINTKKTIMQIATKVRTCLWFNNNGHEAATFYVSLIPNSCLETTFSPEDPPPIMLNFTLGGTPYSILNGGPSHVPTEAASIMVFTEDQEETDRLWESLLSDGGRPDQCAWLKDKYGVSWQIVPQALPRLLMDDDKDAAGRAMQAMLKMVKIDIAQLEKAFKGED